MPKHECRRPECRVMVRSSDLACKADWFALPVSIRSQIWDAWKACLALHGYEHSEPGMTLVRSREALGNYRDAVNAALKYWEENP